MRAIGLVALAAILLAFGALYYFARESERGTSRDDSPAAEAGVRPGDANDGDQRGAASRTSQ